MFVNYKKKNTILKVESVIPSSLECKGRDCFKQFVHSLVYFAFVKEQKCEPLFHFISSNIELF